MREYFLDCAVRGQTGSRVVSEWIKDWRLRATPPSGAPVELPPPTQPDANPAPGLECFICGGARDPYNLVSVYIHKRELEMVREMIEKAAEV